MRSVPVKFFCNVTSLSPWTTYRYNFFTGNQCIYTLLVCDAMTQEQAEGYFTQSLLDALDVTNAALKQYNMMLHV